MENKLIDEDALRRWALRIEQERENNARKNFQLGMFFLILAVVFAALIVFLFIKKQEYFNLMGYISVAFAEISLAVAAGLNFSFCRMWKQDKESNFKQEEKGMSKEYRDGMNEVAKDTSWTVMRFLPVGLLIVAILVMLGWFLQSTGIISMNIDREVVQHSRQYTESKQGMLQNLYTEYANLQTKVVEAEANGATNVADAARAQQGALLAQMKREATNIPNSQIPPEVKRIIQ